MKFASARKGLAGLTAALVAASISSCSASAGGADREPFEDPALENVPPATAEMSMPFDRYELPMSELARTQVGQIKLLTACLDERGFDVTMTGDYLRDPAAIYLWGGRVGTMPDVHAEQYGYQASPDGPFKAGAGFYLPHVESIHLDSAVSGKVRSDPAFMQAWDTPPISDAERQKLEAAGVMLPPKSDEPGCVQTVEAAIDARVVNTDKAYTETLRLAEAHPEVRSRMANWRSCMKELGHNYRWITDPYQEFDGIAVTPEQTRVALDDHRCATSTGSSDFLYAAWRDYQEQWLERDPELFEAHLASQRARLAAVERELGRG